MADQDLTAKADIDLLSKAIAAGPMPKGPAMEEFCRLWAQAKPVLEALQPIVRLIPGIGIIGSAALTALLTAGNAASAALCKS